jgi:DNA-directed RNA polymerase subunit RPC12/RpoP
MTTVVLRASGYTWKCPECGRENYTGPAPGSVRCGQCNGEFQVKGLHHRRRTAESNGRKEVSQSLQPGLLSPLPVSPPVPVEDEIPF